MSSPGRTKRRPAEAGRRTGGLPILGRLQVPPERKDAARNRVRILQAARKLLQTRCIRDIGMDDVAKAAGVGKGTVYRRFEDRASLCRALLHDEAIKLQNEVLAGFSLADTTPWGERIKRLLDALFDFALTNAPLLSEAQAFDRGHPERFSHPAHAWQRETLGLYLERAIASKEVESLNPTVVADLILAGLDPDLLQFHLQSGQTETGLRREFQAFWRRALSLSDDGE